MLGLLVQWILPCSNATVWTRRNWICQSNGHYVNLPCHIFLSSMLPDSGLVPPVPWCRTRWIQLEIATRNLTFYRSVFEQFYPHSFMENYQCATFNENIDTIMSMNLLRDYIVQNNWWLSALLTWLTDKTIDCNRLQYNTIYCNCIVRRVYNLNTIFSYKNPTINLNCNLLQLYWIDNRLFPYPGIPGDRRATASPSH